MIAHPDPSARPPVERAPRTSDGRPVIAHLMCVCQRADPRLALCGADVTETHHLTLTLHAHEVQPCVVCFDLGRAALIARRCGRCPS